MCKFHFSCVFVIASVAGMSPSGATPSDPMGFLVEDRDSERARVRKERRQAKRDAKVSGERQSKDAEAKQISVPSSRTADGNAPTQEAPHAPSVLEHSGTENSSPANAFDLSTWKLTLPTDSDGKFDGHPTEVSQSALAGGFANPYFQFDAKGALVFWCPAAGATTENTKYPRSELREMLDADDPSVNWMSKGTHTLNARCRVLQVPSNPKVVIGQIHGYSGKARPLVKLQYYKGRVEALVKSSPTKGKDIKLTWPDVGLDEDIEYEIKVQDDLLVLTVNGMTQTQNLKENDPSWLDESFYFKAGVYPQDNEGPPTEGSRVSFSDIRVSHTDE